jgi:phage terminase large subunit GpA-like protein
VKSVAKNTWTPEEKAAWKLPDDLTVSQWADKYRILGNTSSEAGPWHTSRTPYLKGIMDAFSDPAVERITIMAPPQSGKTEAILNMIAYVIDQEPAPAMYVMPRDKDYAYIAGHRLIPMIEQSPQLYRHTTGRLWDLATEEINLDRMTLFLAASNSPAGLAMKPIKYLFLDETGKFPPIAGKEASPIDLALKRTLTFWDRKIVELSSPNIAGDHIDESLKSSCLHRYYCKCVLCGEFSEWFFKNLKLEKNLRDPEIIRHSIDSVWYECPFCQGKILEKQKQSAVGSGLWLAAGEKIDKDGLITGKPEKSKWHSGFHYTALISSWVSWNEIMAQWFEANTNEGILKGKLKDFTNSILVESWEEVGRKIEQGQLRKNIGQFSKGTVPDDCLILVAGADYHQSERQEVRIDYEVRGFGYNEQNFVIASGSVSSWEQLDGEVLLNPFPWSNPANNKPQLAVMLMLVDSGFKPDEVYQYCRKRPSITIPTKGASNPQRAPIVISDLDKAASHRVKSTTRYRGMQLLIIDTSFFKDKVTGWAENLPGEGGTQFYAEMPEYYLKEFTNEHKVRNKDRFGRITWIWKPITPGAPTHSLDTAVGAAAAGYMKGVHYLRPQNETAFVPAARRREIVPLAVKTEKRGGFLDNLPSL